MARYIVDLNEELGMTVRDDRARHGRGDGHLAPRHGARFRHARSPKASRSEVHGRRACEARLSRRGATRRSVAPTRRARSVRMIGLRSSRTSRPTTRCRTCCACNAREPWRRDRAAREGIRPLARLHLGRLSRRARMTSRLALRELGRRARRRRRAHRRQPSGLGLRRDRRACRRRAEPRHLSRRAGRGGRPTCCNYAEAKVVIAEDEEQVDKLLRARRPACPSLRHIVYCDPRGMRKYDDPRLIEPRRAARRSAAQARRRASRVYGTRWSTRRAARMSPSCARPRARPRNPKLAMLRRGRFLRHARPICACRSQGAGRRIRLGAAAALDHGADLRARLRR